MKVNYVFAENEYKQLEVTLRRINHDLGVIDQNINNSECVNENLDNIKFFTQKAIEILKGEFNKQEG